MASSSAAIGRDTGQRGAAWPSTTKHNLRYCTFSGSFDALSKDISIITIDALFGAVWTNCKAVLAQQLIERNVRLVC